MFFGEDYELSPDNREYCWLGLSDDEFVEVIERRFNPLLNKSELELQNIGLREMYLMTRPEYFYFIGRILFNLEFYPLQVTVLKELWEHPFNLMMASRGFSKTFSLAVFCLLKMLLTPGIKIVGVGAAFRQSKLIFNYMTEIWDSAPVLRSLFSGSTNGPRLSTDKAQFNLGKSSSIFIPIGDGSKIRGLRAQVLVGDEFDSMNIEIFEKVVYGFMAVVGKPIENMKDRAYKKRLESEGLWTPEKQNLIKGFRNQSIISGTVGDINGNLQNYYEKYSSIIKSKGDESAFRKTFGDKKIKGIDYKDFCVIRIPYTLIPEGFMDEKVISGMEASMEVGTFSAEYGCCPITDTNGFYKKSLVDGATASPKNIEKEYWPEWCPEEFHATIMGSPKYKYVYGVDPAHSSDNFAITILEIRENYTRVVYCWTINKKSFEGKKGNNKEDNYWAYCASKIRSLMQKFPTENIVIDSQGGGNAVVEALRDKDKINMEDGEVPIWPAIDPEKSQDTDNRAGKHILHVVNMSQPWNAEANHNLHKDLSDKILLFPYFDDIEAGLADLTGDGTIQKTDYDRLDECMWEIEELKREIVNIVKQQTPTGKERWDTPDRFMAASQRSGEPLRKDRFSALLLANSVARGIELRHVDIHKVGFQNFSVGAVGHIEKTGFKNPIQNSPRAEKYAQSSKLCKGVSRN